MEMCERCKAFCFSNRFRFKKLSTFLSRSCFHVNGCGKYFYCYINYIIKLFDYYLCYYIYVDFLSTDIYYIALPYVVRMRRHN